MKKLLRLDNQGRWDLDGIEFAIRERVGKPENFIGRVEEMEYLYTWADNVRNLISRSLAFLGRRKIGKSLILERLYNIIYSERKGLIPFYYEFTEGTRSGRAFYHDFVTRFYMQVVGYYTRDIAWIRTATDFMTDVDVEEFMNDVTSLQVNHKERILTALDRCIRMVGRDEPLYEYVISATATPRSFATTVGVEEQVVQMIDEFQYLNMYIDAGVEEKPCKAYTSTAEMKVAPLLITGSLMGVVSHRFSDVIVPRMRPGESVAMTLNYASLHGHPIPRKVAEYVVHVTNNVPGRIVELFTPNFAKPPILTVADVDRALAFEVGQHGNIKKDWDEYLALAMNGVNHMNMRRITYFLCKNEGEWYYPRDIRREMTLDLDDEALRRDLALLHKYDLVELEGGRYGGVFDRTLRKVLMTHYGDILDLPAEDFDAYFRSDNLLDYLRERSRQLDLSLAEAERLRDTLKSLRGEHNDLKGHYYERETLLRLIKAIIDGEDGLTEGIRVTEFTHTLNHFLEDGREIDIVLAGADVVVMAECKNYAPEYLHKITKKMVADFADKARCLHKERFSDRTLRLALFSRHGVEERLKPVLERHGIFCP